MFINILGTTGMCGCPSHYLRPGFGEGVTEILTKGERTETLKDYKRIPEKELESVNWGMRRLKGE
ncbi:MAG: hypothetical protein WED07_02785 [Candidatus Freyarchaeum deiterrae]